MNFKNRIIPTLDNKSYIHTDQESANVARSIVMKL